MKRRTLLAIGIVHIGTSFKQCCAELQGSGVAICGGEQNREKSLRHVAMAAKFLNLNKPWSYKYTVVADKKSDRYDFPAHECTQEQRKWSFLSRKVVEIKTFCYHGNVSSHLSSLLSDNKSSHGTCRFWSCGPPSLSPHSTYYG